MSHYRVTPIFRFKSTITNGDHSKVYFFVVANDDSDQSVVFMKTFALTGNPESYNKRFETVKTFKGKALMVSENRIKVDSLNRIMSELINYQLKEEKEN